jgi:hypothetical protein
MFAKLFDTPHGQLLVTTDTDEEGDPCIHIRGEDVNGVQVVYAVSGWTDETKADAVLAGYTQEMADKAAASLHRTLANLTTEEA